MKIIKRKPSKICPCCGKRFFRRKNEFPKRWESHLYCSPSCRKIKVPLKEFWNEKLKYITERTIKTKSGCIEWTSYCGKWGYGQISISKKSLLVHRVIWEIFKGPIPEGFCVLHTCDNPPCCNIDHLFLGTHQDNTNDKISKGRLVTGHTNIEYQKYVQERNQIIIQKINQGVSYTNLGIEYNIDRHQIGLIARQNGIYKK